MAVLIDGSKQMDGLGAEAAPAAEPVRNPWLVDLPDLSFISAKDEQGNLSPWEWTPNEDWRKLRGMSRRPGVEPSDTSAEKAKDRAHELKKDAELLG